MVSKNLDGFYYIQEWQFWQIMDELRSTPILNFNHIGFYFQVKYDPIFMATIEKGGIIHREEVPPFQYDNEINLFQYDVAIKFDYKNKGYYEFYLQSTTGDDTILEMVVSSLVGN